MASYDKTFTIYTSTSTPRKVLKNHTQIVLTVTPRNQKELFVSQTPIAWKVLDFAPRSDIQYTITWHADPAFAVVGLSEQNINVPIGNSGVLTSMGGGLIWSITQGKRGNLMARNETSVPQTFTLGSVDQEDQFEAFVRFPPTQRSMAICVEPAVMLQAYTVTGYRGSQEDKLLSQVDSHSYLFRKYDGSPAPLDLTTLVSGTALQLSSEPSGRLILEE